MNICLFTDSFLPKIGGMELAVHYLANALSKKACSVTVIAKRCKDPPMPFAHDYALLRYGNRFPLSGRTGADALAGAAALIRADRRRPFDLINCHGASHAASRVYLAKRSGLLGRPIIVTPHGEDIQVVPELGYGLRLQPGWDRAIRRNLAAADWVAAISSTIVNQLDFIQPQRIRKIPNGIHLSEFTTEKSSDLQRRLGLSDNAEIVLSVGRNRRVKGYEYGIRAFAALKAQFVGSDLKYVIIGKDTHALEPLVNDLHLEGTVFCVPQMARVDILRAYASAWCFLSPSLSEGLSLVSIEAMASGLPLIVTDVPGNADIVRENHCGVIIAPKDPQAITRALLRLSGQPSEYEHLRRQALARSRHYDWSSIAQRYIDLYRLAAAQHHPSTEQLAAPMTEQSGKDGSRN